MQPNFGKARGEDDVIFTFRMCEVAMDASRRLRRSFSDARNTRDEEVNERRVLNDVLKKKSHIA